MPLFLRASPKFLFILLPEYNGNIRNLGCDDLLAFSYNVRLKEPGDKLAGEFYKEIEVS